MATSAKHFSYGEDHLTVSKALQLCRDPRSGRISGAALERIRQSRERVTRIAGDGTAVYGINTGFGPLCTTRISAENTRLLQSNLLKSHAVGVGDYLSPQLTRLMLVLKLQALARGFSGISETLLERMQWHLEREVLPAVPDRGSVGASGDLAPLAHLFLPLIGLGKVFYRGALTDAGAALQAEGVLPLELGPKDGLALINGTQFIAAHAVEVVDRLGRCLSQADLVGALMVEGLMGSAAPFRPELHRVRPHAGAMHVAARLHALLQGSGIVAAHAECDRVQDPYSIRCMPQVHGASRQAWLHLRETTQTEINSVTDNPVIFEDGHTISGGNFHGQPLALPLDYACLGAAELGNISDRRAYLALEGSTPQTPKMLLAKTGLNSGFMILQYTAAALASENKSLCFPASADSIPTSLGQEDHVSMGSISGRKALQVVRNLEQILAIELLCAAQAFDFKRPLRSGPVLEAIHRHLRSRVEHVTEDRIFSEDISTATEIIRSGALNHIAHEAANQNQVPLQTEFDELFEIY